MLINNTNDLMYIPPIHSIPNGPQLLNSRRRFIFPKEKQPVERQEVERQTEQIDDLDSESTRIAAAEEAALTRALELRNQDREIELERERILLQQMQAAAAVAQQQIADDNSAASIAETLKQMTETIAQIIENMNVGEAQSLSAQAISATPEAETSQPEDSTEDATPSVVDMLREHIENRVLHPQRDVETAYHMQRPSELRPDVIPVVTPLYHEDEYV